jgi:hypothetical protein
MRRRAPTCTERQLSCPERGKLRRVAVSHRVGAVATLHLSYDEVVCYAYAPRALCHRGVVARCARVVLMLATRHHVVIRGDALCHASDRRVTRDPQAASCRCVSSWRCCCNASPLVRRGGVLFICSARCVIAVRCGVMPLCSSCWCWLCVHVSTRRHTRWCVTSYVMLLTVVSLGSCACMPIWLLVERMFSSRPTLRCIRAVLCGVVMGACLWSVWGG